MKMVKERMGDVGLEWNPKKCAVVNVKRGVHANSGSGMSVDKTVGIPCMDGGKQYKFLGVLECVMQEDNLVSECAAREYLRRMSMIWSSPLSVQHRVSASNQFGFPVLGYLMWTQQWTITDLREINREARKIGVEN